MNADNKAILIHSHYLVVVRYRKTKQYLKNDLFKKKYVQN